MPGGWSWEEPSLLRLAGLWMILTLLAALYIGGVAACVFLIVELT